MGMPLPADPWLPPPYDLVDIAAVKAVRNGVGTPEQQKRAFAWIIECASRSDTESFHPTVTEASAYNEGKRSVGRWIRNLSNMSTSMLTGDSEQGT